MQVVVFLDNRPGSLFEAISQLDNNQLRIFSISIAEAGEFGVVRLITEEPEKAIALLQDAGFSLAKSKKNTEVTAFFPEFTPAKARTAVSLPVKAAIK